MDIFEVEVELSNKTVCFSHGLIIPKQKKCEDILKIAKTCVLVQRFCCGLSI